MENPAERRLRLIARHLRSPQIITYPRLNPNPTSAAISPPVVIGAMVLDIHAKPSQAAMPGTTVPGTVKFIHGGVARNIAQCMSKLGSKPFIVSVVGTDVTGEILLKYWESAGLPTDGIEKIPGASTPSVSNTFDFRGEVAVGVASVEAVEKFVTPGFVRRFRHTISSAPVVVVDANLHPQSLEAASRIAAECGVPVWFEPVSVAKSTRIASIVKYVTVTSPNEHELIAMANALSPGGEFPLMQQNITNLKELSVDSCFQLLKPAINLLLDEGIKLLVLTLGSNGAIMCFREAVNFLEDPRKNSRTSSSKGHFHELVDGSHMPYLDISTLMTGAGYSCSYAIHLPALPASVLSLTGAGDCLVGGIIASICNGVDVTRSVAMGIAVAKVAVESENNIPAEFSLAAVAAGAQQSLSNARQLMFN